ncbi:MAG TPA: DUF6049 family protein [Acidimicrobiia bacterium]
MRRTSFALLVTAAAVALTAAPVAAGTDPPPTTGPPSDAPRILLAGQPAWAPIGGNLPLQLQVEGQGTSAPGLRVTVTAHRSVSTRTAYEAALRGENLGSTLGHVEFPLDVFPPGAGGIRTMTLGLQPEGPIPMRATGVYPFEVELRDQNEARLAGFVTPVVAVAAGENGGSVVGRRLGVSLVLPMVSRPAYGADGKPDPEVLAELAPEGRLGQQAIEVASSAVPLTLAPGPETLESWTQLARDHPSLTTSLDAVRAGLSRTQVLSGPYVPIDIRSLLAGGLGREVGTELVQGSEKLSALLGTRVDPRTEIARPVSDAALARLRDAGVDRVILDGGDLAPREEQFTPAQPFVVRSQQGTTTAVGSDAGLQRLLDGADPVALRAQRFLGALATIALEQPNVPRGVVVLEPPNWDGAAELLRAMLAGLQADHPLLQPMTVDQLLETVPAAASGNAALERQLAPSPVPSAPVSESEFADAETELGAFNALVPPPNPLADAGSKALLVSLSSAWSGTAGRARARAELATISFGVNEFLGRLRVPAGNSTITLTARQGEIPVTFLNETGQQLRVRVRLRSDKLVFPGGDERVLDLPPRSLTVRFGVETRGSGTFPMTLTVTSPDGALQIQRTEVQVRSTFVSNVGVFLTVGAVLFLGLWWGNDFRRRRKRRAAQAATPAHPVLSPPSAAPGAGQSSGP